MKNTSSRRRWAGLVLAGALATTGMVAVTQAADAPAAEAAVCGSIAISNGYAYANNPCGFAYAEVGRKINGSTRTAWNIQHRGWVWVSWSAGSRAYEYPHRW